MKNKKVWILGVATVALLSLGVACGGLDNTIESASVMGVEIYRFKVGEGSDAKVSENVTVKLSNGKTAKAQLNKTDLDYNKIGAYDISFSYGVSKVESKVYVYGTPTLYYYGEALVEDVINVSYRDANESYDFVKNVTAADSFGEKLTVTVSEDSAKYDGGVGSYEVIYTATDCVNNVMERTITYQVTMDDAPDVSDTKLVLGKDLPTIPADFKGAKEAYLYKDGALLSDEVYSITENSLKFTEKYVVALGVGEHDFVVRTVEGVTGFTLDIANEGYPVYEMNDLKAEYQLGTTKSKEPVSLVELNENCTFAYVLKDANGNECFVQDEFGELAFLDGQKELVPTGNYTLEVTGSVENGAKKTVRSYAFSVVAPTFGTSGVSKFDLVNVDESKYGVSQAYHFVKFDKGAWDSRLEARVSGSVYDKFTFDIWVNDASTKSGEFIGTKAEDGQSRDNTPQFSVTISADGTAYYDNIQRIYDKATGVTVKEYEMKIGRWYTIEASMARQTQDGTFYFYVDPYGTVPVTLDAYIANVNFHPVSMNLTKSLWTVYNPASGAVTLTESKDDAGNVILTYKNTAASAWDGRAQFSSKMLAKYQEYYDRATEAKPYEFVFDFKHIGTPSNLQFWCIDENGYLTLADPSLTKLQSEGIATVVDELGLRVATVYADKWYTVRIDVRKLGRLGCRKGTEMGLQFGVGNGEVQFRNVEFREPSAAETNWTAEMFEKLSSNATLSGAKNAAGETVMTYNGHATWDGRIQFTEKFMAEYKKYYAKTTNNERYLLSFDICFVSEPNTLQFWQIFASGMSNDAPTLKNYIERGTVRVTGANVVNRETDMKKGNWYTITFDLYDLGALDSRNTDRGLQLGSISSFEFKNVKFEKAES